MNNLLEFAVITAEEREAIKTTLKLASVYGYGNMIAWLNTAWEAKVGMHHSTPYNIKYLNLLGITPEGEDKKPTKQFCEAREPKP